MTFTERNDLLSIWGCDGWHCEGGWRLQPEPIRIVSWEKRCKTDRFSTTEFTEVMMHDTVTPSQQRMSFDFQISNFKTHPWWGLEVCRYKVVFNLSYIGKDDSGNNMVFGVEIESMPGTISPLSSSPTHAHLSCSSRLQSLPWEQSTCVCVPFSLLVAFFCFYIFLSKHPKIFPLLRTPLLYRLVHLYQGTSTQPDIPASMTAWIRDFSNTYHAQTGRCVT